MRNIAVVNATGLSAHALRPLREGRCALDLALEAARALPAVERVVLLASDRSLVEEACARAGAELRRREAWDAATLLRDMAAEAEGFDHLFSLFGDYPLLDTALACRMFDSHTRYFADYTFADGYPVGLAVEIVKRGALGPLAKLAADVTAPIGRDILFTVVQRDINSFDIETELSPEDLRHLRLVLAADTKRNFLLLERLLEQGVRTASEVASALTSHPEMLRTLPAYFTIQVVEGCPQLCSYCPYPSSILAARGVHAPGRVAEMPRARLTELLGAIRELCEDAVVSVSLWGEPALHSEAAGLLADAASAPGITLQVETSGVGWSRSTLEHVRERALRPPTWIVSLDAYAADVYTRLRGPGFAEALETAETLRSLFPQSTYLQVVRMRDNEEDTEAFYRSWKERKASTIIQKYDSFAGRLPDRAVTDLSPLERHPCWHLKRDVAVLLDGSVGLCREDLDLAARRLNVFTDGLPAVWERGQEPYLRHVRKQYPEICQRCDEYYTYNA